MPLIGGRIGVFFSPFLGVFFPPSFSFSVSLKKLRGSADLDLCYPALPIVFAAWLIFSFSFLCQQNKALFAGLCSVPDWVVRAKVEVIHTGVT